MKVSENLVILQIFVAQHCTDMYVYTCMLICMYGK